MLLSPTVVSNNILVRAFKDKKDVSPMKLQKLLYFISCEYAKACGTELFSEDFGVWQYGPVLQTVYDEFKSFKGNSIKQYAKNADGKSYMVDEHSVPKLEAIINKIWGSFGGYDAIQLSRITHLDGSGWSRAFNRDDRKITLEDMKEDNTYASFII